MLKRQYILKMRLKKKTDASTVGAKPNLVGGVNLQQIQKQWGNHLLRLLNIQSFTDFKIYLRGKPGIKSFKLPASNIKHDTYGYRQQWFDFKKMRYIQWVKEQIDLNKGKINE
jgi:hypothetical protein